MINAFNGVIYASDMTKEILETKLPTKIIKRRMEYMGTVENPFETAHIVITDSSSSNISCSTGRYTGFSDSDSEDIISFYPEDASIIITIRNINGNSECILYCSEDNIPTDKEILNMDLFCMTYMDLPEKGKINFIPVKSISLK